jgi:hypothetical protein
MGMCKFNLTRQHFDFWKTFKKTLCTLCGKKAFVIYYSSYRLPMSFYICIYSIKNEIIYADFEAHPFFNWSTVLKASFAYTRKKSFDL